MLNTRSLLLALSTVLVITSLSFADDFRRGGVDGSGRLDITDSIRVLDFLFLGSDDPQPERPPRST